jgi:tetratricopeptide (TPR) repeat protein
MNAFARKTVIVIIVMTLVAFAGWGGRKIYLRSTVHRLVGQADGYLEKKDYKQASLCLRRALSLNPFNLKANQLMGDLLEEAGSPAALGWRIRAVQLQTNNMELRLAWAQTALKVKDLSSAGQALAGVDEKSRSTAEYHKLRGALAWGAHVPVEAEKEYAEALRLEPTNQVVSLNLATIGLASTNLAVAEQSRRTLERVPTNSILHLMAVRFLMEDAVGHKSFDRALLFSRQLVDDPKASYGDKLAHLQILDAVKSAGFNAWLATLKAEAAHAPQQANLLSHWLSRKETPSAALTWLQSLPAECRTNLSVQLAVTDFQIVTKDWTGLLAGVQKQDWDEFNYYRLSLQALANRNLGDSMAQNSAWRRVLIMSSSRLERLQKLDQLTAAWAWPEERTEVLKEIISAFPKEAWAGDELVTLYYTEGNTHALAELLDQLYSANPSNLHVENNLATVLMLLKSDTKKANRLALESYTGATNNPFFACTYAYSLLLQSKPAEAAKVVGGLNTNTLKVPSIAAYYGVVEAETGHKDAAREALKLAQSARLLPEEKELVRKAEAQL